MKMNLSIIIVCLLSLIICNEEGGVKIAINDGFINQYYLILKMKLKNYLKE